MRKSWNLLKKGDLIDLVASSSTPVDAETTIPIVKKVLEDIGFRVSTRFAPIDSTPLGYANSEEVLVDSFYNAMTATDSQAVWEIRGGAGATRLWSLLQEKPTPSIVKPLIGFSDTTGLHSYVNQVWRFTSLHGVLAEYNEEVYKQGVDGIINDEESICSVTDVLTGKVTENHYKLTPLNDKACHTKEIESVALGGNMTLMIATMGNFLSPRQDPCILVLEAVGAIPHDFERYLDLFSFSLGLLDGNTAIEAVVIGQVLADDMNRKREDESQYEIIINRFSKSLKNIPVYRGEFFGHGAINRPIGLGAKAKIKATGDSVELMTQFR